VTGVSSGTGALDEVHVPQAEGEVFTVLEVFLVHWFECLFECIFKNRRIPLVRES